MKQRTFTLLIFLILTFVGVERLKAQQNTVKQDETIFIWGGDINTKFVQYISDLTEKENPTNMLLCQLQVETIRTILNIGEIYVIPCN